MKPVKHTKLFRDGAVVQKEPEVHLIDLIMCLSDAMDFISPEVVNHHIQVAYIALGVGDELELSMEQKRDLVLAGALHDIGAFSLKERLGVLAFDAENTQKHADVGYSLLNIFEPLEGIASVVKFHHVSWDHGKGSKVKKKRVPLASHILHLADRVAVLVNRKQEILGQARKICETVREQSGKMFMPSLVEAFERLAVREYFWLDLVSPSLRSILSGRLKAVTIGLDGEDLLAFSRLFARIIDFKSPFTATHSSGVAACAEMLADRSGFSPRDCTRMRIAGYLHDLGKLAVPVEILDKPSRLGRKEFNVIMHHAFYTRRILDAMPALNSINAWASFHHERLDGSGYPFHLRIVELPLGSQIMAVADVFTAITEDRPYRSGMTKDVAINVLEDMANDSALNPEIVSSLKRHHGEIDIARRTAQAAARNEYKRLRKM
jgi:HD-GYP domain-containing protein (c-di-GMP phosphodiesterase class II)